MGDDRLQLVHDRPHRVPHGNWFLVRVWRSRVKVILVNRIHKTARRSHILHDFPTRSNGLDYGVSAGVVTGVVAGVDSDIGVVSEVAAAA